MSDNLSQYQGPGKFEGELNITAYAHSLCPGDQRFGDIQEQGEIYDCIEGPLDPEGLPEVTEHELTPDDLAYLKRCGGVVLREDSQGFVTGTWFDTQEEYRAAVAELEEEFSYREVLDKEVEYLEGIREVSNGEFADTED